MGKHVQNVGSLDNEECIPYKGWCFKIQKTPAGMGHTSNISAGERVLEGSRTVVKDGDRRTGGGKVAAVLKCCAI